MSKKPKAATTVLDLPGHSLGAAPWDLARATFVELDQIVRGFAALPVQSDRQAREVVLAGLLRRSFSTAQGVAELVLRGQVENAMALSRTQLEIAVAINLVCDDPTDAMARRLVGYDYYWRHKYGNKLLSDAETRAQIEEISGEKQRTAAITRSWRDQFEGQYFDEVRERLEADLKSNKGWHGRGSIDDAFASVKRGAEYLRLYTLTSPFVHGTNVEWDFDAVHDGKPFLRDIAEWKPDLLRPHLGMTLFRLHEAASRCVGDRFDAPPLTDGPLNTRRKEMLQAAKASLYDLQRRLVGMFGKDTLADEPAGK